MFSSKPTGTASYIDWQDFILKKSAHVVVFGTFATLVYRALKESGADKVSAGYLAILAAIVYGILDEIHQSFTPGRGSTFRDVIFDTIGAVLAIYLIWKRLPKMPPRLRRWAKDFQLI